MEKKIYFINQLKKLRAIEFYNNLIKLVMMLLFIFLSPIVIYEQIISNELLVAVLFIVAEIVFIGLSYGFYIKTISYSSINKSRIFQCIDFPERINEIIVSDYRILFEIKNKEDESIFIKRSAYRDNIIDSIKSVFGSNKVVFEVEKKD